MSRVTRHGSDDLTDDDIVTIRGTEPFGSSRWQVADSYLLVLAMREVRLFLVEPVQLPRLLRHHLIELLDKAVRTIAFVQKRGININKLSIHMKVG